MFYDSKKYVVEEIPSFSAFARIIRPVFSKPEIRKRNPGLHPSYVLVELYDAASDTCLGSWEDEYFDFAAASDEVIDKLDDILRVHFKMKKRPPNRVWEPNGKRTVGFYFKKYTKSELTEKGKKPRRIESLEDFYRLATYAEISIVISLRGGLRSSHNFEVYRNHIIHDSMVDGNIARYTKREFETSFYAKAIRQKAMFLEGILGESRKTGC